MTHWQNEKFANIQWRDGLAYSLDKSDFYGSRQGREGEFNHVYANGNNLYQRFSALNSNKDTIPSFSIGEIGFGLGLNFFFTAKLFVEQTDGACKLSYYSAEFLMPCFHDIEKAWSNAETSELCLDLLKGMKQPWKLNNNTIEWRIGEKIIALHLWIGDALSMCHALIENRAAIDAWYLDGFRAKDNPEAWDQALLGKLADCSENDASFATFSSTIELQNTLKAVVASVEIQPGYSQKKYQLTGRIVADIAPSKKASLTKKSSLPHNILIVGKGITGALTARLLAELGVNVHITGLESSDHLDTGIFHPQLSSAPSMLSDQRWNAWSNACEWLRHYPPVWLDRAVLQLFTSPSAQRKAKRLLDVPFLSPHVEPVQGEANQTALIFQHCGSFSIKSYIDALLSHENINVWARDFTDLPQLDVECCVFTSVSCLHDEYIAQHNITQQMRVCANFSVSSPLNTCIVGNDWLASGQAQSQSLNQISNVWIGTVDAQTSQSDTKQQLREKCNKLLAVHNQHYREVNMLENEPIKLFTGRKTSIQHGLPLVRRLKPDELKTSTPEIANIHSSTLYVNCAMGSRGIINACWSAQELENLLKSNHNSVH